MTITRLFFLSLILLCGVCVKGYTQTDTLSEQPTIIISMTDGSVIKGKLVSRDSSTIVVVSEVLGTVEIGLKDIEEFSFVKDNYLQTDEKGHPIDFHNSTHYLVSPSAYGLKKGQSYYENIGVFWNSYSTGITDNFSISVGGEIVSLLFASSFPVLFVTPKYSMPFNNNKGAVAVAGTIFTVPENDFTSFGFLTGSVTLGSRNNNVTLGTGLGWSSSSGFENEFIPFTISTMIRVGPKMSFLSENWIVFENDFNNSAGVISAALRFHFKNAGSAFNAGLFRSTEGMGDVIGIPFVSATIGLQ